MPLTRPSRPPPPRAPTRASISAPKPASSRPNKGRLEGEACRGDHAGADVAAEEMRGAVEIGVDIGEARGERAARHFEAERPIPFAAVEGAALAADAREHGQRRGGD